MLTNSDEYKIINEKFGILDHIPIGILILKNDFTVLFWNTCIEDWTEISRNKIIGTDIRAHFTHFKTPKYISRLNSIFEGGPPTILSSQLHRNIIPSTMWDGLQRVQHSIITPVRSIDAAGYYALFSIQDVTDLTNRIQNYRTMRDTALEEVATRKRAQHELLKIQEELEVIIKDRTADLVGANKKLRVEVLERRQIEEELKELVTMLNTLLENIPEGVLLMDTDNRVVHANDIGKQYLETLSGRSVGEIISELAGRPMSDLLAQSQTGIPQEIVMDGPLQYIYKLVGSTVKQGLVEKGKVLVLKDITEERGLQERINTQERLAAVGQLAAGIAHDFNNILTGIIGFADILLAESSLTYEYRQMVEIILENGKRAAHLISQILDYSRKSSSVMKPLDLSTFLNEFTKFIRRTIPEYIEISLSCGPDECFVFADPTKIQQIFANLALNARDAMPDGGVLSFALAQLHVAHSEKPPVPDMPDGDWVVLTVSDTGTGITPEIVPHLFEPFFTTKEPGKGTGLGLSQVYGIVKQHKGFLDVQTRIGRGTSFIVYLPAVKALELLSDELKRSEEPRGKAETVLVVEDNEPIRTLIERKLTQLNYKVITASNGRDAVRIFEKKQNEIKLVITDIVMPEMGGIELCRMIKGNKPFMKLIALSGYPLDYDEKELLHIGFAECIKKPFNVITLVQSVYSVLDTELN